MQNAKFNCQKSVATGAQRMDYIPTIQDVDYNRDYLFTTLDFFGVDKANRPSETDDATVKKYAKSMVAGEWYFELSPIYVGITQQTIFNGEHRRKAIDLAKAKGLNPVIHVRFVDDRKDADSKREALNSGKHWNADDHIEALISAGNKDFAELKKFAVDEDHPQLHSVKGKPFYNRAAIAFGSTFSDFKKGYETGDWNITRSDIRRSEQTYNEMVRIKKAFGLNDAGHDFWINLGQAWKKFYSDEALYSRVKKLPNGIESFYEALSGLGTMNSYKTEEWLDKYKEALGIAENNI